MERTTTEIYTSMTCSLLKNDLQEFQKDIICLVQSGEDVNDIIYFMVDHYSCHALSCNTDIVKKIYMKLHHLHKLPKKKQRNVAMKQLSDIASTLNHKKSKNTKYAEKIGNVSTTDIEIILSSHEHIGDFTKNDMLGALKTLIDQEKITYDMMRLLSCLVSDMIECNKREVLKLVMYLCNQKALKIGSIDYTELTQMAISIPNKRDIVWYLWHLLIIKSKSLSPSISVFVKYHFQLYSLLWTKKSKPMRINLLYHVFALLSSMNVDKYIIKETVTDDIITSDMTFDYLNCYTSFNKDLAETLERERREYTCKLKVHAKSVDALNAELPM